MLLKPSVNVDNIERLIRFIESETVPWSYTDCARCFMGQCATILGVPRQCLAGVPWQNDRASKDHDTEIVANFLGLSIGEAYFLCWNMEDIDMSLDKKRAISILRELAVTGRVAQ